VFPTVHTVTGCGQWLGKQVAVAMDMNTTIEERCFLCGLCRDVAFRTVGAMSSVMGYLLDSNDMSIEAKNLHC
jgi:hypothetical protein